jgi:ATP-dependent DNA helicase DinG
MTRNTSPRHRVLVRWHASGPDPAQDCLLRVEAGELPGEQHMLLTVRPPDSEWSDAHFRERVAREYGCTEAELAEACSPQEAWEQLERFCFGAEVIVADTESFLTWRGHFGGPEHGRVLSLSELAALFLPGRWAARPEELIPNLCSEPCVLGTLGWQVGHVGLALKELLQRVSALDPEALLIGVQALSIAAEALAEEEPELARTLESAMTLLQEAPELELGLPRILPKRLDKTDRHESLTDLLAGVRTRGEADGERWRELEPLPPTREDATLDFPEEDMLRLDRIFEQHLPRGFAGSGGSGYRAGQHQVAREVARTLASEELLLVHAPTGTGKTLAYLVPMILWARRHELRTAVATFTRALQEQAFDREVPRALAALAMEGAGGGVRVSLLKGRENYCCWRALKLALPQERDDGASWLAWAHMAMFALIDPEADLDRLPLRLPLRAESATRLMNAAHELRRNARAQTSCCRHAEDRHTCGAELARLRAERSHVVIVNQAFTLARPEFFRTLVFDECEHLHDQAHSIWSRSLGLSALKNTLARIGQPDKSGARGPLDRARRFLVEGTPSHEMLERTESTLLATRSSIEYLRAEAELFLAWREEEERTSHKPEAHALLQNFLLRDDSRGMLQARIELGTKLSELESDLAELTARLAPMPMRQADIVRRGLELSRADLIDARGSLEAWMPLEEGLPVFIPRVFYDVERDPRGYELQLASRVLLPQEFLGRTYYPLLRSAAFVSATTWLNGGFESALSYLGLERAARPAEEEERPPVRVRSMRAPDPFDYSRVLVCIPRDAPSPKAHDKQRFLAYVRRFIAHLGERTRGRMLVLFTNAADARQVGEELKGFFRARKIPLWYQNQEGTVKEELSELFRSRVDSILLGVDTFWYGADFPGETLEYLVIVKLPYGVPDRYHEAQCAALGTGAQRKQIYMPRALAKFRQGFGRLMRRESDRGCVFILDGRVLEAQHRVFLRELPIENSLEQLREAQASTPRARLVRGDTELCIREALTHMGRLEEVKNRGLSWTFETRSEHSGREPS